jgi:hypothetical protein
VRAVSKLLNMIPRSVLRLASKHGVELDLDGPSNPRATDAAKWAIENGATTALAGEKFGLSDKTVSEAMIRMGAGRGRGRGPRSKTP